MMDDVTGDGSYEVIVATRQTRQEESEPSPIPPHAGFRRMVITLRGSINRPQFHNWGLNGNCGEATNSDDVKGKQGKQRNKKQKVVRKIGKAVGNVVKAAVKAGAVRAAATALGAPGPAAMIAHKLAMRITGSGDYTLSESPEVNSLFKGSKNFCSPNPSFRMISASSVRVSHSEFVTDILTPSVLGTTEILGFRVNPGLSNLFSYLSNIAQGYEEYMFHGLVFELRPMLSGYVGSGNIGSVCMTMEYNSLGALYPTKSAIENSDFAVSARLDKGLVYGVECAKGTRNANTYFIRNGAIIASPLAFDFGELVLGLFPGSTVPASTHAFELWAHYDVELIRPRVSLSRYGWYSIVRTGIANDKTLGTTTSQSQGAGSCTWYSVTDSSTFSFNNHTPGDVIMCTFSWYGALVTEPEAPAFTLVGCQEVKAFDGLQWASINSTPDTGNSGRLIMTLCVAITASVGDTTPHILFGGGSYGTSWTFSGFIAAVGSNFTSFKAVDTF